MTDEKPSTSPAQPPLRPLGPNERIVRTAGLKFILPNQWKEGDTLSAEAAALINTAYHTAVINRFGATRQVLLENPATTYQDFDRELQAFYEDFKVTSRPTAPPEPDKPVKDENYKALEAFARPHFNKAVGKMGVPRADYERLLTEWITGNREYLEGLMLKERHAMEDLTAEIGALTV